MRKKKDCSCKAGKRGAQRKRDSVKSYTIKTMTIEDYDGLYALWMTIHGFGIRSVDDSREGVEIFLKRNPTTSVVAVSESGSQ